MEYQLQPVNIGVVDQSSHTHVYPPGSFPIPLNGTYNSAIPGMMPGSALYPGSIQQPMPQYSRMAILDALGQTTFTVMAQQSQPPALISVDPSFLAGLSELNSKREQEWLEKHQKMLHMRLRGVHYVKREVHLNFIINELFLVKTVEKSAQPTEKKSVEISLNSDKSRTKVDHLSQTKLVIFYGAPVSGKSTLAQDLVTYLQSNFFSNKKLNAFWLNASNGTKLQQDITEMVYFLGDKQLLGRKSSEEILAEVFRNRDENFIIVLDNAEFDIIKECLKAWEDIPKLILIVTAVSKFKHTLKIHSCEINLSPGFSLGEAIEYLKQTAKKKKGSAQPFDEEGAKALLSQIGYLPLDLQLVANELNVQKKSYREYAKYISEKHADPKSFQVFAKLQRAWLFSWEGEHYTLEADNRALAGSPVTVITYQRFHDLIERWDNSTRFDKDVKDTAGWPLLLLCSVLDGKEISDDMLKAWFSQRNLENVPKLEWEINYQNLLKYFVDNNLLYEPVEASSKKNESRYYSMHPVTQTALISFKIEKQKIAEDKVDKYYKSLCQQYRVEVLNIIVKLGRKPIDSDINFFNGLMLCHQADYLLPKIEEASALRKPLAIMKMNLGMYAFYALGQSQQAIALYENIVVDKQDSELQDEIYLVLGRLYLTTERWEKVREILDKLQGKHERGVAQYLRVWLLISTTLKPASQIDNKKLKADETQSTLEQEELQKQIRRLLPFTFLKTEYQLLYALPVLLSIKLETAEWGCNKLKPQLKNHSIAYQVSYYQLQAQISAAKKDLEGQIEAYQAIITLAPKQLEIREKLAKLQAQQGDTKKAVEILAQTLPLSKEQKSKHGAIVRELANCLITLKQNEKAIQHLEEANKDLKEEPQERAQNSYLLGNCYRDNQQHIKALKEYEQACKNSPAELKYWLILLETTIILQEYSKGLSFYQDAIKHYPNNSELLLWGACLYYANKDSAQMWNCFCRALPHIASLSLNKSLLQELYKALRTANIDELEQQWLKCNQKNNKTDDKELFWEGIYKIFTEIPADAVVLLSIVNKGLNIHGKHEVWQRYIIEDLCKKGKYVDASHAIEKYLKYYSRRQVCSLPTYAVYYGLLELLKWWLKGHKLEAGGPNLLVLAYRLGHTSIAEYLLQKGVDPNFPGTLFPLNSESIITVMPLHLACIKSDIAFVEALIGHNVNVNTVDADGKTPLMNACLLGHAELVRCLLKHKADVDVAIKTGSLQGLTALHFACMTGDVAHVEALFDHNANVNAVDVYGKTPLIEACLLGHAELVRCLLKHKADVDVAIKTGSLQGDTALHIASMNGDIATLGTLLIHLADVTAVDANQFTPLMWACWNGHVGVVEYLLEHKATVNATIKLGNSKGMTALHLACFNGDVATVETLLAHQADVNASDIDGNTPLIMACREGNTAIVECLLVHKANVNVMIKRGPNKGMTPLHMTCFKCDIDIMKLLLAHQADINATDANGDTPLIMACREGHTVVVECLLVHKAIVNTTIKSGPQKGATALHYACVKGNIDIVKTLLAHQADIDAADANGITPFILACAKENISLIQSLLNADTKIVENPINTLALAIYYSGQSNIINAISWYKKTIELDANNYDSYHNLACMYHVQGNDQLAEANFKLALNIQNRASTHVDYGFSLLYQARLQEAAIQFYSAILISNDESGLSYGKLDGKLLDKYLQKEVTQSGFNIQPIIMAHYWLVQCFHQLNELELKQFFLKRFVELVEKFPSAIHYRLLSYTYLGIDDKKRAKIYSVKSLAAAKENIIKLSEDELKQSYIIELIRTNAIIFDHPVLQQYSNELNSSLLSKYNLPDLSSVSLEKGLIDASQRGEVEDLKYFIARVSNINAQDTNPQSKRSALHWSVIRNDQTCIELLIKAGADTHLKDYSGKSPYNYATESVDSSILNKFTDNELKVHKKSLELATPALVLMKGDENRDKDKEVDDKKDLAAKIVPKATDTLSRVRQSESIAAPIVGRTSVQDNNKKITEILKLIGTEDKDARQLGSINIIRDEVSYSIKDIDNYYTADMINILLYSYYQSPSIQTYPALPSNQLNDEYIQLIISQHKDYVFIPLNVGFDNSDSAHKNHWVALIIDKRHGQLFYLDPPKNDKIPLEIVALKERLNYTNAIACNPIDFQEQEMQEGFIRHCGVYVVEIFEVFATRIQQSKYILGNKLPNNDNDEMSIPLQSALSEIPSGEAAKVKRIRENHIDRVHSILAAAWQKTTGAEHAQHALPVNTLKVASSSPTTEEPGKTSYSPTLFGNASNKSDNNLLTLKKEVALPTQEEIRKNYAEFEEKKKSGTKLNSAIKEEEEDIPEDKSEASSESDSVMQRKQTNP